MSPVPILAVLAGKIAPLTLERSSAIGKIPLSARVKIGFLGIEGDEQADKRNHGGPDKALHHYPADHYPYWDEKAVDHPLLNMPGAFGENLSTWGLLEDQVCIGDRYRCGTALLEVSQGREPCHTQGLHMQWTTLPQMMVRERRSGWYYRVIEEGEAGEGDDLSLVDRVHPEWTVKRVFGLLIAGDFRLEPEALPHVVCLPQLFEGWRQRAVDLMGG